MLPIVNVDTKIYIRGVVVTKEKVTEKVFENQPNFTVSANATNQSRETVKLAENSIHNIFNKFVSDKNFKSNTNGLLRDKGIIANFNVPVDMVLTAKKQNSQVSPVVFENNHLENLRTIKVFYPMIKESLNKNGTPSQATKLIIAHSIIYAITFTSDIPKDLELSNDKRDSLRFNARGVPSGFQKEFIQCFGLTINKQGLATKMDVTCQRIMDESTTDINNIIAVSLSSSYKKAKPTHINENGQTVDSETGEVIESKRVELHCSIQCELVVKGKRKFTILRSELNLPWGNCPSCNVPYGLTARKDNKLSTQETAQKLSDEVLNSKDKQTTKK